MITKLLPKLALLLGSLGLVGIISVISCSTHKAMAGSTVVTRVRCVLHGLMLSKGQKEQLARDIGDILQYNHPMHCPQRHLCNRYCFF